MKKLKAILALFAIVLFLAPNSMNAGAECAPCGASGIIIECPSTPNGSACGYWFPDENVAAVTCHPSGNLVMVDCEGFNEPENALLEDTL